MALDCNSVKSETSIILVYNINLNPKGGNFFFSLAADEVY